MTACSPRSSKAISIRHGKRHPPQRRPISPIDSACDEDRSACQASQAPAPVAGLTRRAILCGHRRPGTPGPARGGSRGRLAGQPARGPHPARLRRRHPWVAAVASRTRHRRAGRGPRMDLWAAAQQDQGAESSTVRRRLSALSSFYRYCAAHDLDRIPTAGVSRPGSGPGLHRHGRPGPRPGARPARGRRRRPGPAGAADRGGDPAAAAQRAAGGRGLRRRRGRPGSRCRAPGAAGDAQRRPAGEGTAGPGDDGRTGRLPY